MSKLEIKRVEKPWGYELIWAKTESYVGKILHVKKGHRLSLQYHEVKEESIFVKTGKILLVIENDEGNLTEVELSEGEAHHIGVNRKHRMIAVEDSDIFEVSTPHLDDVVRIEDSYGRSGTSAP